MREDPPDVLYESLVASDAGEHNYSLIRMTQDPSGYAVWWIHDNRTEMVRFFSHGMLSKLKAIEVAKQIRDQKWAEHRASRAAS